MKNRPPFLRVGTHVLKISFCPGIKSKQVYFLKKMCVCMHVGVCVGVCVDIS